MATTVAAYSTSKWFQYQHEDWLFWTFSFSPDSPLFSIHKFYMTLT